MYKQRFKNDPDSSKQTRQKKTHDRYYSTTGWRAERGTWGCGCVRVDGGDSGGDGGSEMRQWIRNVHDGAAEGEGGKARRDVGSSTGSFLYITKTAREESHERNTCTARSDPVRSLTKKGDARKKSELYKQEQGRGRG